MTLAITKAVIPVAGLGTRFLPATKAMPKEMLPVVDKPVIQYVVEEAVSSGAPNILMVTGRNKSTLENHFDRAVELENRLTTIGDTTKIDLVSESTALANIHYVRQGDALGLGHAVLKAKTFVGSEPFVLLLGDEIIHGDDALLSTMMNIATSQKANVIALFEVPVEEIHKYGVATVIETKQPGIYSIDSLVEKPALGEEKSNLAVVGRYVLQPGIFEVLEKTNPGYGGEIQLTDALHFMSQNPTAAGPVFGVKISGKRMDMGNQLSFLKATVELASEREDLGPEFKAWLNSFVIS